MHPWSSDARAEAFPRFASLPHPTTSSRSARHHLHITALLIDAAWQIFTNGGLNLNGVRVCGDYMFSGFSFLLLPLLHYTGHTIMLTSLNFFLLAYTPRNWQGFHALTWLLNVMGMFFILAGIHLRYIAARLLKPYTLAMQV
jgi:hypothetical protein